MSSRKIVIGVGGGIAAYKACSIIRRYVEDGHQVRVLPTKSALKFVGAATFEALSGHAVSAEIFEDVPHVPHVRFGQEAELVVVAPATADLLARAANGQADDLLTATLLTARCPVLFAPAMHTEMWEHPATQANVATLRERGAVVVEPASGRLTGADSGPGRLPEPEEIAALGQLLLERPDALPRDLVGVRVLVTAGGTREPLDPVRFLGNRSSGKQGYALARLAAQRGAKVTLVAGTTAGLPDPAAVKVVRTTTAQQMGEAVVQLADQVDVVVMAAAVADFRAKAVSATKIKKTGSEPEPVILERNEDILASLVATRKRGELPADLTIVGFAAETGDERGDVLFHARHKLASKGCDLLVVNAVTEGNAFEVDENAGWILGTDGTETALARGSKAVIASRVLDAAAALRSGDR